MKHSPFLTLVAATAMTALLTFCGSNSESDNASTVEREPLELTNTQAKATEAGCDTIDDCALAYFRLPLLKGGEPEVTERINSDVEAVIREHIKARLPEPMAMGSYTELAEAFIDGYSLFANEFPDNPAKWYFEINGDSSSVDEEYFMLRLKFDEFMGGAHPNSFVLLQNYRLSDGELVDVRGVVDEDDLSMRAETAFRRKHRLNSKESLNDAGFMFEDDEFNLPENMAISNNRILLIYNPYEVASYSTGYTVLRLPLEEKQPA
ncbi:MAG: DUF3298 and DUF4163 domain-containing protein [Flavobacteriales bacterium]|nr:DUF3298 and DUF4163 domain-containing protein [Flavobacteriales bacterium]